ncbi:MAG: replication initiation protein [Bacteroidales bacterium]|nr:replication initiation protein [Bacteroidales bacterium]
MAEAPQNKEMISKEVVESYIFTTVRHDFGIYSERLLLRLVELAQSEIRGLDFKGGTSIGKVEIGEWGDAEVVIPVKDILSGEDDKNYSKAKQAVKNLMGRFLEYEDDQTYKATQILNEVDVDKVAGKMVIRVNRNIWRAMLDFSKGFRKYELETAVKLRGKYSLRIYKLISKQSSPITYSITELRQMWGLTEKYKKVDDFIKNTIVSAKEELDRVSPYSFDYILNAARSAEVNKGRKGRPSITSVTFFPVHRMANESADAVRKQVDPSMMLDYHFYQMLKNKFEFDSQGIKANITLFDTAQKECDILEFLDGIAPAALRAANIQGYVVNAIRKHLKERFGIVIDGSMVLRDTSSVVPNQEGRPSRKEPASLKDILGGGE